MKGLTTIALSLALMCVAVDANAGRFLKGTRAGTGVIVLTWEAPLRDGDNDNLSDLSGYVAYCGMSRGVYSINSGALSISTLTYTFTALASGTWYCTVTAKDSGGNESFYAIEASKAIP